MRRHILLPLVLLASLAAHAQQATPPVRVSRYLPQTSLIFEALVPQPPAAGTPQAAADLAAVHRLQTTRTAAQIKAAQQDDREESIFAFADVIGPGFTPAQLPLTAQFSLHLREESAVVNPALKLAFKRQRPFLADSTIHPVCQQTASDSYPSGHSMVGYLEAFALSQIFPDKADAITKRADDYANNRVVCGVHYPSDVAASHTLAAALFGALSTSPRFQQELAAVKQEISHMPAK